MTGRTTPSDAATKPVASVIVPSFRGAARLPALLDSLAAQEPGTPPFEVIVVVDGVDDGSPALVAAETRLDARAILLPANLGRVTALNTGFEAARGDVLIRCDDDLVVPASFVAAHVAAHEEARAHGRSAAVAGLTRDVHEDSAYARAYGADAARSSFARAAGASPEDRWRAWAANCSIDRATWERIGPYDTAYRAYGWEDVDYGWRLHAAGIPLARVPGTDAEHHGPARSVRARTMKAFDSGAARALFVRRHPEAPMAALRPGGGPWGLAVRATAALHPSARALARTAGLVDRVLGAVPVPVGRKLAALAVESGVVSGVRAGERDTANRPGLSDEHDGGTGRPRIAIAHDYLTQRGGAERLVLSICRAFPEAEIHTLFYEPDQTYPEYADRVIRTSPLNRIGPLRRDPRLALPLLAPAASRMRIDADVVVASSSGWAHAFPTRGRTVVYCHSPARWLYLPADYLGTAGRWDPKRLALAALTAPLMRWDRRAAGRAARYLANSTVVRERIRRVYGIEAKTLFPPFSPDVADGPQEPIAQLAGWAGADGTEGGHHLVVSRLQPYKNVDLVIEAFRSMPERRLLVIGKGPEGERLRALAPDNVRLVEGLSDAQMRWAYAHARALVAASHEDFGLTPLEAGAHGVPVVALRAGGYLDTIREGVNGVFFEEETAEAIRAAVVELEARGPWDRAAIRERAGTFSEERFIAALREVVDDLA
ncbi:glycosyltransferase [Brachybacterium huguangmaarense]